MSDEQWVPDKLWAAAVGDVLPETGEDCRHERPHHIDAVMVEGAAVAAVRCMQCGRILGTGSDG